MYHIAKKIKRKTHSHYRLRRTPSIVYIFPQYIRLECIRQLSEYDARPVQSNATISIYFLNYSNTPKNKNCSNTITEPFTIRIQELQTKLVNVQSIWYISETNFQLYFVDQSKMNEAKSLMTSFLVLVVLLFALYLLYASLLNK